MFGLPEPSLVMAEANKVLQNGVHGGKERQTRREIENRKYGRSEKFVMSH